MTSNRISLTRRILAGAILLAGCTEPNRTATATGSNLPVLEARLELSDSSARANSELTVFVRLHGASAPSVGSFTARVAYDSLALTYLGETAASDSATRVANPQPGMLRIAGIAPKGFTTGTLYTARFTVLKPASLASLRLLVDEMHSVNQADVSSLLTTGALR